MMFVFFHFALATDQCFQMCKKYQDPYNECTNNIECDNYVGVYEECVYQVHDEGYTDYNLGFTVTQYEIVILGKCDAYCCGDQPYDRCVGGIPIESTDVWDYACEDEMVPGTITWDCE